MTKYQIVGTVNAILGIIEIVLLPFIYFFSFPKLISLYNDFGFSKQNFIPVHIACHIFNSRSRKFNIRLLTTYYSPRKTE